MKQVLLSLLVIFSLLMAPVAYAAGIGLDGDCHVSEQTKKQGDNDSIHKVAHHCCLHMAGKADVKLYSPMRNNTPSFFPAEDARLASVVLGPPLQPPSHG